MNFNGPSMAVDTACSSSLTAIHLACESLARGETRFAIAGGVNLSLHPYKYIQLSRERFLASDGRCRSFGAGGDGYVPGEGVGAILLRPLAEARAAGDRILGVIKGTAINHGGTTNGFTVPNPNAQGELVLKALRRARVDPKTLGYIEAHGTGTSLGDPIEIAGLSRAFQEYPGAIPGDASGIVPIGSVKSNIGHLESAAGIAGVMKVLLQMRAGQIAPSLTHSDALNPNIDFETTPFRVQTQLADWQRKSPAGQEFAPRRAAVSSFGAGGSNGHVIIEEYIERDAAVPEENDTPPQIVPLSARSPEALRELAARLLDSLDARSAPEGQSDTRRGAGLADIAHTLRTGRVPLEERLVFVVHSIEELRAALEEFVKGGPLPAQASAGNARSNSESGPGGALVDSPADREFLKLLAAAGEYERIAAFWAAGATIHWIDLYSPGRKASLPGYPFARERYWLATTPAARSEGSAPRLHPLIDANVSTLYEEKFVRRLSNADSVIRDHRLNGRGLFPGAGYLEMARAAGELAWETPPVSLEAVVWQAPFFVADGDKDGRDAEVVLLAQGAQRAGFEVRSATDGVHARGLISISGGDGLADAKIDPDAIRSRTGESLSAETMYASLASRGLEYGETFRSIQELRRDPEGTEALARLSLPGAGERDGFILHPSVLDGAFQSTVSLVPEGALFVPYYLEQMRWTGSLPEHCLVHIIRTGGDESEQRFDLTLADEAGRVCAVLRGFTLRAMRAPPVEAQAADVHYFVPGWVEAQADVSTAAASTFADFDGDVLFLTNDDVLADAVSAAGEARSRRLRPPEAEGLAAALAPELAGGRIRRVVLGPDLADPGFLLSLTQFLLGRPKRDGEDFGIGILILSDGQALARSCAGFARALRLERPDFEISLFECRDPETRLTQFARAAIAKHRDVETRMGDGRPMVRDIRIMPLHESSTTSLSNTESTPSTGTIAKSAGAVLRQGGVYLITGGAGGLGLIFAEFFMRQYGARIALAGRRPLTDDLARRLARIAAEHPDSENRVAYFSADLSDPASCESLARDVHESFGELHGIVHSAGVLRDSLVENKSPEDFQAVLAAKIQGTINLDRAFANTDLDFVALFSSVASVAGNRGQTDYAAGNAFLDAFAEARNDLVRSGERRGHCISLNWPLWSEGGMTMDADARAVFERVTGLRALDTGAGLRAFETALRSGLPQVIVAPGDAARILNFLNAAGELNASKASASAGASDAPRENEQRGASSTRTAPRTYGALANPDPSSAADDLLGRALVEMLAALLKIDAGRIRADNALSEYGVDSVALTRFASQLNDRFELSLNPSIFFEYTSIAKLARHLREEYGLRLESPESVPDRAPADARDAAVMESGERSPAFIQATSKAKAARAPGGAFARSARNGSRYATENAVGDVAIVGLHCNFPGAPDPAAFWENLANRRDMIGEVPPERWDWRTFAGDPLQRNRSVSRWGGFVAGLDKFDPLFFGLSPREAELMDPQQRILLETVWKAIEDAGYQASSLSERPIGLFVGVSTYDYMRRINSSREEIDGYFSTGNVHSIVANRISYLLNLRGPSEAVDTACSSSLVALHNASRAIQSGDCEAAIVGGVNALTDPDLYISFSKAGMLSPDGRCKTFDRDANGYVRGEGAGAVYLKPLERALADGDHVYGVIRGSAVNHGGRAQSMTAPNPAAQAELLVAAYRGADISPDSVSYIEAHGTGTALGDPIEINGLKQAFAQLARDYDISEMPRESCALGSAKTSIGHLEAAAGMAGLIKVLLMFRHRSIPGNVNFNELNPYIDFDGTPFYVARDTRAWDESPGRLLRAGVSSFGFGGANAHVVLEEFAPPKPRRVDSYTPAVVVPLSAQDKTQLRTYAAALRAFAANDAGHFDLERIAFTLQTGREAFAERLAIVAESRDTLLAGLDAFLSEEAGESATVYAGTATTSSGDPGAGRDQGGVLSALSPGALAGEWVQGAPVAWNDLYAGVSRPQRFAGLPTYPFRRETYWIGAGREAPGTDTTKRQPGISPLIDANISTFGEQKYRKRLQSGEWLLRDHRVGESPVLPGAAYLEMARAAGDLAEDGDRRVQALRSINWSVPIFVSNSQTDIDIALAPDPDSDDRAFFEVRGAGGTVHADGELIFAKQAPDVQPANAKSAAGIRETGRLISGADFYEKMRAIGLAYGPAFQVIKEVYAGEREALAELELPRFITEDPADYRLHPVLLDGALQACAAALPTLDSLFLPAYLGELILVGPMSRRMFVHARTIDLNGGRVARFNLELFDEDQA
ncbi:MAG: type I polyketide synthase, partial [Leptospirales bacterium]